MAASMVCRKSLLNIRNCCFKRCQIRPINYDRKNSRKGGYFIFLPEVPKDTRETNPIMRFDEYPTLSNVSPSQVVRGCAKLSQEFESKFDKLMEELREEPRELSFDELFNYIETYLAPLLYAEHQASIITMADTKKLSERTLDRIHNVISRATVERYLHVEFFKLLKKLDKERDKLTDTQRSLLDKNLLECRLAGSDLAQEDLSLVSSHKQEILQKGEELVYKSVTHSNLFSLPLGSNQWDIVKQLPRQVLLAIAEDKSQPEKGPWKINLLDNVYESFIEVCSRRDLRSKVWNAKHTVGTIITTDIRLFTHEILDDIRDSRKDVAQLLGYEHYAAMSMETKMAKDVQTVLTMLETYRAYFLEEGRDELHELHQFAETQGFREPLKEWDIPYYRLLQAKEKFRVEKIDRLGYFTFDKVLNTLLNLCEELFHIKFEIMSGEDSDMWHPDVRAFDIYNNDGSYVSRFYLDPFARLTKSKIASAELGRERSDLNGMTPLSFIMLSLNKVNMKGVPTLVSYQEVLQLFYQFGNALQQMLTTVPYAEISGQKNIELDCKHVCAYVMKLFAKQPWVVKQMSEHYQTGKELTDTEITRLLQCQTNLSAFDMCNELYKSAFDIECHLAHKEKYWKTIQEEVYKLFMPMELHPEDWLWCSDTTLWIGKTYAAGYYQHIWSQMLAANIFEEFESSMDNKNLLSKVGKRFRDNYLSLGGGLPGKLVFRQFVGRDPSFDSLITRHKIEKGPHKTLPQQEQQTLL